MTDNLVENIRRENYILEIFEHTKDSVYVNKAKDIISFVKEIYRHIEPSHFDGRIVVFFDLTNEIKFSPETKEELYDKTVLSNSFLNIVFQLKTEEQSLPLYWTNVSESEIETLLMTEGDFIAYIFEEKKEFFVVNKHKVNIVNKFRCPSIFALQYHYLDEALLDYKTERIKNVSCKLFQECWADPQWLYLKNRPEDCMQSSLSEFLKSRVRGINVTREDMLGASRPVDISVSWREANRVALIELKWMGQSLKENGELGTKYSNGRANDGMRQIKEYIDLNNSDTPTTIAKGYLVVIDARRQNISSSKASEISRNDGFYYQNIELEINEHAQYWRTFSNIEKPIRMFVEPICEM